MPAKRSPAVRNIPLVVGGALAGAQLAVMARRLQDAPPEAKQPAGRRLQGHADGRTGGHADSDAIDPPAAATDWRERAAVDPAAVQTDVLIAPPVDPAELDVSAGVIPSEPVSMQESELQLALAHAQEEGWPQDPATRQEKGGAFGIAKDAVMAWIADGGPRLGASIAFYTIFAIAPLMLILLAIAGAVFGEDAARGQIMDQISGLVGTDAAKSIQDILAATDKKDSHGVFSTIIGIGTALIGASAVFVEMKNAFDTIFKPQPEEKSAVTAFVRARLMSVALVLAVAFLVVVSLVLSAGTAAFIKWMGGRMPFLAPVLGLLDVAVSTGVLTAAFWMLIRYLPERAPNNRAVLIGALVSALLFAVGKRLISMYLAYGAVGSAYGAAGSFIVVVMWVYYSSQILLLGAEVSRAIDDPAKAARKATEGRAMTGSKAG